MALAKILFAAGVVGVAGVAGNPLFESATMSEFGLQFACVDATLSAIDEALSSDLSSKTAEYVLGLSTVNASTVYTNCSGAFDFAKKSSQGVDAIQQKIQELVSSPDDPWGKTPLPQDVKNPTPEVLTKVLKTGVSAKMMMAALALRAANAVQKGSSIGEADTFSAKQNFLNGKGPFKDQIYYPEDAVPQQQGKKGRSRRAADPIDDIFVVQPLTTDQLWKLCAEGLYRAFKEQYGHHVSSYAWTSVPKPTSDVQIYPSCLEVQTRLLNSTPFKGKVGLSFSGHWTRIHNKDDWTRNQIHFQKRDGTFDLMWSREPTSAQVSWPSRKHLNEIIHDRITPTNMKAMLAFQAALEVNLNNGIANSELTRRLKSKLDFIDESLDYDYDPEAAFQKIPLTNLEFRFFCIGESMRAIETKYKDAAIRERAKQYWREWTTKIWDTIDSYAVTTDCTTELIKVLGHSNWLEYEKFRDIAKDAWNGNLRTYLGQGHQDVLFPTPQLSRQYYDGYTVEEIRAVLALEVEKEARTNSHLKGDKAVEVKSKFAFVEGQISPLRKEALPYNFAEASPTVDDIKNKCVFSVKDAIKYFFDIRVMDESKTPQAPAQVTASNAYPYCLAVLNTAYAYVKGKSTEELSDETRQKIQAFIQAIVSRTSPGRNPLTWTPTKENVANPGGVYVHRFLPAGLTGRMMEAIVALQAARAVRADDNVNGKLAKQLEAKLRFLNGAKTPFLEMRVTLRS